MIFAMGLRLEKNLKALGLALLIYMVKSSRTVRNLPFLLTTTKLH